MADKPCAKAIELLRPEFPTKSVEEITNAFSHLLDPQILDGFVGSEEGKAQTQKITLALNALERLKGRLDALPDDVKRRLDEERSADVEAISRVGYFLENERDLGVVYHRHRAETGGRDHRAIDLADLVHMAMTDLEKSPTYGLKSDESGEPSTAFGRIVQIVLDHHGIDVNWRAPAKEVFDRYRDANS